VIVEWRYNVLMVMLAASVQSAAAQPAQPAQGRYSLTVTKDITPYVTLTAEGAKLSDVAADLARRLGAQVIVAPSLKDEKISAKFAGTPIEPAMLTIAPRVFVDYEVRQDEQPRVLGIYLLGDTDPEPSVSAVVHGSSQGVMISGNTEDTGKPPAADAPLRIIYNKKRLTVYAKQQPLMVVVMAIAEEMGVPAEIKDENVELINVNVKDTPAIEETIAGLSPNVRVYVRSDATRLERTLLRVVVVRSTVK
jgi:type II secretory pathway component GspD/PulD (secretin)